MSELRQVIEQRDHWRKKSEAQHWALEKEVEHSAALARDVRFWKREAARMGRARERQRALRDRGVREMRAQHARARNRLTDIIEAAGLKTWQEGG